MKIISVVLLIAGLCCCGGSNYSDDIIEDELIGLWRWIDNCLGSDDAYSEVAMEFIDESNYELHIKNFSDEICEREASGSMSVVGTYSVGDSVITKSRSSNSSEYIVASEINFTLISSYAVDTTSGVKTSEPLPEGWSGSYKDIFYIDSGFLYFGARTRGVGDGRPVRLTLFDPLIRG